MAREPTTELLDRLQRNAAQLTRSYESANQLLDSAVGEAFPWVLGLPVVRGKIPPMFRNALPKGIPVTLDRLERLTTQLLAILLASYDTGEPTVQEQNTTAKVLAFAKEK